MGTKNEHENDDIVIEETEEQKEQSSFKKKTKEKKQSEIEQCRSERQEYLDGWQRSRAEYANLKKESEERVMRARKAGQQDLLEDIIPVLDSFDMAFSNQEVWESVDENWRKGIEYIHTQFTQVLERYNVTTIADETESFNPEIHEPLEVVETTDESQDGALIKVMQKGYRIGDKIVRPAKVQIYKFTNNS